MKSRSRDQSGVKVGWAVRARSAAETEPPPIPSPSARAQVPPVGGSRFALRARVLAREVRERAGELVFLDTGRFAFFETAPSKGIAASQIQSTQDINPPVVPTEWWARWATQVVEAEAALRAQWA